MRGNRGQRGMGRCCLGCLTCRLLLAWAGSGSAAILVQISARFGANIEAVRAGSQGHADQTALWGRPERRQQIGQG